MRLSEFGFRTPSTKHVLGDSNGAQRGLVVCRRTSLATCAALSLRIWPCDFFSQERNFCRSARNREGGARFPHNTTVVRLAHVRDSAAASAMLYVLGAGVVAAAVAVSRSLASDKGCDSERERENDGEVHARVTQ